MTKEYTDKVEKVVKYQTAIIEHVLGSERAAKVHEKMMRDIAAMIEFEEYGIKRDETEFCQLYLKDDPLADYRWRVKRLLSDDDI